jgi:NitT/TauT family transport system permease protein
MESSDLSSTAPEGQLPPAPASSNRGFGRRYFTPREPIPAGVSAALAVSGIAMVIGAWAVLSYAHVVDAFFLPPPSVVAATLYDLVLHQGFLKDIWASSYRILLGFLLAAVIGVPLGIAIGSFRAVQALLEPVFASVRYMPASAFIPLLIIWYGIGDQEKVAVIFIGVFFPLVLVIADVASNVPREFLDIAYTLGASRRQVFFRVLLPAALPGVVDLLRIAFGWAWTYLIVAELVAASTGIGYVILSASRYLRTDQIIAGIITIGALGLLTDFLFRLLYARLFPYAERVAAR